jgi:hypothetical protein
MNLYIHILPKIKVDHNLSMIRCDHLHDHGYKEENPQSRDTKGFLREKWFLEISHYCFKGSFIDREWGLDEGKLVID